MQIENLSIGYKGNAVCENFSLSINQGEMIGLKGRNGRGKTTLLKTICGLIPPIKGCVIFNGMNIHSMSAIERAKCISIVLTQRVLLQGITVRSLVEMGRYPNLGRFHFEDKMDEPFIDNCLFKLGITHLAAKPLAEISDGELQKAMIARALAQQTPIILMDEPTAFLDYVAKAELFELLSSLVSNEGISVLFSSHDIEGMQRVATRVVEL